MINTLQVMIIRSRISGKQIHGTFGYGNEITNFGGGTRAQTYYPYGYMANPSEDTLSITFNIGGTPANQVTFPYHAPIAPFIELQPDEVIIGNPVKGNHILFDEDGGIQIVSSQSVDSYIKLKADGTIEIKGDLSVIGNITATQNVSDSASSLNTMRSAYNPHTHIDSSTNPTSAPDNLMPV